MAMMSGFRQNVAAALLARMMLGALAACVYLGWISFEEGVRSGQRELKGPITHGAVLTGDFPRIDAALALMQAGLVHRLFITGANPGAGITPETFVPQFSRRNPSMGDIRQLVACCIEFGVRAETTIQNAFELKCWSEGRVRAEPLLVITSAEHMPRAMAALSKVMPDHRLVRFGVSDEASEADLRQYLLEFKKFLITAALAHAPVFVMRRFLAGPFAGGCT